MYQQKFNPYGQFPSKSSQLYQDEDEYEEDEPLVEEVDSNYEPTDKEVKQYAIDTLGMTFPGDQNLLYLAREGLKAPLPPNWVPYQSRNGEVYYKHRITQEKTYDHPTDIEYQKKYIQQKEKMARTNLKSMNMKANQFGMSPNSNVFGNASNPFAFKTNNSGMMSESSNIAQDISKPAIQVKLDPGLESELKEEVEALEEKLKKEWRDFEDEEGRKHQKKMKKAKQQYESELDRLFRNKASQIKMEDKLREQKQRLKNKIEDSLSSGVEVELKDYQKDLQSKIADFIHVYEEDNKLKISKYQSMKDNEFEKLEEKYNQNVEKGRELKEKKKKEREEVLSKLKSEFQKGSNQQIQRATVEALEQELVQIRQNFTVKLKEKENQLQREYSQMKKVLGFDQSAYITEIALKKARMKKISEEKLQSIKRKQLQILTTKFTKDLEQSSEKLKQKMQLQFSKKMSQERHRQEGKLQKQKQKIDQQIKTKSEAQLENIYDELKLKIRVYETEMNKKLSTLNQKFISDIVGQKKGGSQELTVRLELKQKQMTLENKTQMVASLKRQQELQKITYDLLKLQNELSKCLDSHEIDMKLMKLAKTYDLEYRTQEYLKFETTFKEMKNKYKRDKEFLASVMNSLQSSYKGSGVGGAAVLKQYNQDVRVMRDNDQMLRKYEILLKKAEINDKIALNELSKYELEYNDIHLRRQMGKPNQVTSALQELSQENIGPKRESAASGSRDIDSALREHSKFLTSMRHELNRKLYKLRGSTYY